MELFRLKKNQELLIYFRVLGKKVNFDGVFWFFICRFDNFIPHWSRIQVTWLGMSIKCVSTLPGVRMFTSPDRYPHSAWNFS